jgi:hypothetical protein
MNGKFPTHFVQTAQKSGWLMYRQGYGYELISIIPKKKHPHFTEK